MSDWRRAFAPATVSNVGPGFDAFGFAIDGLGDAVLARTTEQPGIVLAEIRGRRGELPLDAERNTASVAAGALWQRDPVRAGRHGLELILEKGMPYCSGLGSSAASAVAGAMAAALVIEQQCGQRPALDAILDAALAGEAVASGARHADNVAPSLLGGFTIVIPGEADAHLPRIARFLPRLPLCFAVVTPALSVPTREARAVLPREIPLEMAVAGWAKAAGLVLALCESDEALFQTTLRDRIVEPRRAPLIRGYDQARAAALAAGALCAAISGSGPTLFAACRDRAGAEAAADAIQRAFARLEIESERLISPIAAHGAGPR